MEAHSGQIQLLYAPHLNYSRVLNLHKGGGGGGGGVGGGGGGGGGGAPCTGNIQLTSHSEGQCTYLSFFLYILPDPLSSIIGRCTLYTPGCRMRAYK